MKYRVKFKCYWYNTGAGDNHYYTRNEDFDTIEEAEVYRNRVDTQFSEYDKEWENSSNYIEVENGFIASKATVVKYFPEREEAI